jgi:hypothetical protein
VALATLPQAEQIACSLYHHARVAASPFPILSGDQQAGHESGGAFRR